MSMHNVGSLHPMSLDSNAVIGGGRRRSRSMRRRRSSMSQGQGQRQGQTQPAQKNEGKHVISPLTAVMKAVHRYTA